MVRTCATFSILDLLHKLSLTSKASTYDFYRALEKLTNNMGVSVPKVWYRQLFRMSMQWRHLKLLKWGGHCHDSAGVAATHAGGLAVLCPSCPRLGVNLLEDWEEAPVEFKYVAFSPLPTSLLTSGKVFVHDVFVYGCEFSAEKPTRLQLFTRPQVGYGLGIRGAP